MQGIKARCVCFVLLCIFTASLELTNLAYGQTTSGSLTGQVTDPSGAVVPGATVTVTNLGTNLTQSVKTDSAGHTCSDPCRSAITRLPSMLPASAATSKTASF